jgi:hypothetical protein
MPATIGAQSEIRVGKRSTLESNSPSQPFAAVFEDDGETGYFYALDLRQKDDPIQDAVHIYNVAAVSDRKIPSTVQIVWSSDGLKAGLIINRYPHAVFDFAVKRAVCRTGFPPPCPRRGWTGHDWDDSAVGLLV